MESLKGLTIVVFDDNPEEAQKGIQAIEEAKKRYRGISCWNLATTLYTDLSNIQTFFGEEIVPDHLAPFFPNLSPIADDNSVQDIDGRKLPNKFGIITDLMMPLYNEERLQDSTLEPWGLFAAIAAMKRGIPVVVCSDLPGHGEGRYGSWFLRLFRALKIPLIPGKDWNKAVEQLIKEAHRLYGFQVDRIAGT
jgi:hypothetical protein